MQQKELQRESDLMVIANAAQDKQGSAPEQDDQQQEVPEDKLNLIVSNRAEYFDLLFELLNLGVPEITQAVWKLMMQIPINQKLFNSMRSLQSIRGDDDSGMDEAAAKSQLLLPAAERHSGW